MVCTIATLSPSARAHSVSVVIAPRHVRHTTAARHFPQLFRREVGITLSSYRGAGGKSWRLGIGQGER